MLYFKTADGKGKGHVNDEKVMKKLEEFGYIRLKGKELFLHICWNAVKKWAIPAVCGLVAFRIYSEVMVALIVFISVQEILD